MSRFFNCFALFALVCAGQSSAAQALSRLPGSSVPQELKVVASIKPLALIAKDLLGESGIVEVLVKGAASPHDYALKVSDMHRLDEAQLIVWMGPELERFLEKPLATMQAERALALGAESGSAASEPRDRAHDHQGDLHQWLDPRAAKQMAAAIARRLEQLYPAYSAKIEQALAKQAQAYDQLHRDLQQSLIPVKDVGFVVQHRGYDHLVEAYGLNQVGWIAISPEQPPGVRHLFELEKTLRALPPADRARCLFVERSQQSATTRNFAHQLQLRLQALDILGESASSYPELMRNMAGDLLSCLAAPQ